MNQDVFAGQAANAGRTKIVLRQTHRWRPQQDQRGEGQTERLGTRDI